MKGDYLDLYEGIQSEVISTTRFDENSDLSTTYLDRTDMTRASKIKAEETLPILEQGYMRGKLLDGTNVRYYWILEQANHSCLDHTFYDVSLYICCQNLLLKIREFR